MAINERFPRNSGSVERALEKQKRKNDDVTAKTRKRDDNYDTELKADRGWDKEGGKST